jgi:hypothetical protein
VTVIVPCCWQKSGREECDVDRLGAPTQRSETVDITENFSYPVKTIARGVKGAEHFLKRQNVESGRTSKNPKEKK